MSKKVVKLVLNSCKIFDITKVQIRLKAVIQCLSYHRFLLDVKKNEDQSLYKDGFQKKGVGIYYIAKFK